MKFGHFCLPTYFADVDGTVGEFMRRFVELLAESEELGFDSLWANEHHFDAYGGIIPSPPTLLSALSQRTRHARLGTSIVVLPLHSPIEIAEQFAMIDLMSGGRVELGVGRGFVVYDYDRLGVPREDSQERLREGLEVIRHAWSGKPFSYDGRFYKYRDIEVWPRPEQRPHPPIWLSCSQTPSSFAWAGEKGFSILTVAYRSVETLVVNNKLYREAWAKAGHPKNDWRIAAHYQVVLSKDGREAKEIARKALVRYTAATTHTLERLALDREYETNPQRQKMKEELLDIDRMVEECRVIAGTPDEAVRLLERAQDMMGFTQCDCTFYWGGIPYEAAQRSQRLFATEVMPRLRKREPQA